MSLRDNIKGASLMTGCMASYAFNDAFMKVAFEQVNFFQAIFLRGLVTIALLMAIATWRGEILIKISPGNRTFLILRVIGEVGATVCFLSALAHMPLANATAILQAVPFVITLGAAIFLKEPVGWRRWVAISVGFFGVLMIIRPGMDGFDIWSLFALLAVALIVLRDLVTTKLTFEIPAVYVSLMTAIVLTLITGLLAPMAAWKPVTVESFSLLASAATILTFGYVCSVATMRVGAISFIAPFRYSILLFAIFLGGVLFDEYPDALTLIGSVIIIGAGLYTIHREHCYR